MNTEINSVAIASLGVPSSVRKIRLREGATAVGHLAFGFIKFLMISAPFLAMVMMLLALWGIVGKTTYADLDAPEKHVAFEAAEAKNYKVNETKNSDQCTEELKSPDIGPERPKPMLNNIDWEHTV